MLEKSSSQSMIRRMTTTTTTQHTAQNKDAYQRRSRDNILRGILPYPTWFRPLYSLRAARLKTESSKKISFQLHSVLAPASVQKAKGLTEDLSTQNNQKSTFCFSLCETKLFGNLRDAKQMGSVDVNGGVHTARKQHQRICVRASSVDWAWLLSLSILKCSFSLPPSLSELCFPGSVFDLSRFSVWPSGLSLCGPVLP